MEVSSSSADDELMKLTSHGVALLRGGIVGFDGTVFDAGAK